MHKATTPNEMQPRVLRQLGGVAAKPLSMTPGKSWQPLVTRFMKGRKEDPGNSRPVSLTSVPGEIAAQILLDAVLRTRRTGR